MHKIKVRKYQLLPEIFIKIAIFFSLLSAFTITSFFVIGNMTLDTENINTIESTIKEVVFDEIEEEYIIKVNDNSLVFKVSTDFDGVIDLTSILKKDDLISISYSIKQEHLDQVPIISITYENKEILNMYDEYKKNAFIPLIMGIILLVLSIICLVNHFIFKNKSIEKEYNYYEYYAKLMALPTIGKKDNGVEILQNKKIKTVIIYIVLTLIIIIMIAILGNKYPDHPHIIIPIVVLLMTINTIYLFIKTDIIYIPKKGDISQFVYLYKKYICSHPKKIAFYETFSKTGYKYEDYLNYIDYLDGYPQICEIEYEKLDLFTVCYFKNKFHCAYIYICSKNNPDVLDNPLIIPLNNLYYKQIKINNVHIDGLDYLLENLKDEIENARKNKIHYKEYY